jgi:hypothetical protein
MSKLRLAIVEVTCSGRTERESLANRRKTVLALRARIVFGCASGTHNKDAAAQLGIDPVTASNWRRRSPADRLGGINGATHLARLWPPAPPRGSLQAPHRS